MATIKRPHRLCRSEIWDAGQYKEKDVDIIQAFADGRSRVRFKTLPAKQTPKAMREMIELWQRGVREKWVHPLVLAAVLAAIDRQIGTFRVAVLQGECPGVGLDLIRVRGQAIDWCIYVFTSGR